MIKTIAHSKKTYDKLLSQLDEPWGDIVNYLTSGQSLRTVQSQALNNGLLDTRKNFLVSAPTNAGKSLIGTLVLLEAVKKGQRAILLEPLRALAREQADSLERLSTKLSEILGQKFSIRVSTGDYRLDNEQFADPAPVGELIVATPERLEAILRNPENQAWLETVGAVCVDEAHLISNPRRGPILEFLITSLLSLPYSPRLALLSATLGNIDNAKEWLRPCQVVKVIERYPLLTKEVLELGPEENANAAIVKWLSSQLEISDTQALVFVYTTRSTESLAKELSEHLENVAGKRGALAYHSKMSSAKRDLARQAFLSGDSRILVTTSALAMGVNLPATHVVVRDLTYQGAQSPNIADLLQMMGRAGRGDQVGNAVVIKKPKDDWTTEQLQRSLDHEVLPEFRSAFIKENVGKNDEIPISTVAVSSFLSRASDKGHSLYEIERFLGNSLGGHELVEQVASSLQWLENHSLAFQENGNYSLTVLGRCATMSVLPLPLASGFAQLIRDLLSIDSEDEVLAQWKALDHLVVLHLLYEGVPKLRRYSEQLSMQVSSWCENEVDKAPMLFSRWIDGEKGYSKAAELLGSLEKQSTSTKLDSDEWARQQGYLASFHSIVLLERGRGRSVEDLSRQFSIDNLEGHEERWRDEMLWLLAGIAKLLEIKTFYYYLREECEANSDRIKQVKHLLARMRQQVYELQGSLVHCSALGPALHDMRRLNIKGVGERSIRKLEGAGVSDLKLLYQMGVNGMIEIGVRPDIAKQIQKYLRCRAV